MSNSNYTAHLVPMNNLLCNLQLIEEMTNFTTTQTESLRAAYFTLTVKAWRGSKIQLLLLLLYSPQFSLQEELHRLNFA